MHVMGGGGIWTVEGGGEDRMRCINQKQVDIMRFVDVFSVLIYDIVFLNPPIQIMYWTMVI